MLAFLAVLIINVCWAATIPATPENITVTFLTPTAVRVAWQTLIDLKAHPIEKYIVTYKPADDSYRVVQDIAGNSEAVILDRLSPGTQYSIAVTAIWLGKKYRSRQIIFRTLDSPKMSLQQEPSNGIGDPVTNVARPTNGSLYSDVTSTASSTFPNSVRRELPQIRGVEVGIVFIVLMVWAGAIALFFNRWGKIRMLLPYQPDYKHEQLKVPGTGVCSGGVCSGQHSHQFEGNEAGTWTYQSVHCNNTHFHTLQEAHSASVSERCSRSRINSAIFVSTEGKGFDSIEFLRRHGSQSVLCRKAKSAENVRDHGTKRESAAGTSQWGADEGARAVDEQKEGMSVDLELRRLPLDERHGARTLPVLNLRQRTDGPSESTLAASHSAAVITSDAVVGSISIEAPPAYLRREMSAENSQDLRSQYVEKLKTQSASRYSTDTMEEFIVIPQQARQHKLVYQRSSSSANPSQSSAVSIDNNDHAPSARGCRPKVIISPVVSVTEPSPPHEASDVASECL